MDELQNEPGNEVNPERIYGKLIIAFIIFAYLIIFFKLMFF